MVLFLRVAARKARRCRLRIDSQSAMRWFLTVIVMFICSSELRARSPDDLAQSGLLIVELRANGAKAGFVYLIRLPILGTNEAFASQSFEDVKRAVHQKKTVTGETIDR